MHRDACIYLAKLLLEWMRVHVLMTLKIHLKIFPLVLIL